MILHSTRTGCIGGRCLRVMWIDIPRYQMIEIVQETRLLQTCGWTCPSFAVSSESYLWWVRSPRLGQCCTDSRSCIEAVHRVDNPSDSCCRDIRHCLEWAEGPLDWQAISRSLIFHWGYCSLWVVRRRARASREQRTWIDLRVSNER